MTDAELIAKRLAFIETCLRELREDAQITRIRSDVRERRFVEHTLQLAIQAALDIGSHIVSEQRLGEPQTNHEIFDRLAQHDWLPPKLAPALRAMAGFRNILVHGYTEVNLAIVADVVENHLSDLDSFIAAIRAALAADVGLAEHESS